MDSSGIGKEYQKIDLLDLIPPDEGLISLYYGIIGSGKTYGATADVLADLRAGKIVYTNWPIDYRGFDDRTSLFRIIFNILIGRKRFYYFPKENLRRIIIDDRFVENLSQIVDAKVYLDEGHVAFDSYLMAKMDIKKRQAALETRHSNRSIILITQRPTAAHVSLRANVNIFYKFEKIWTWPFIVFRRTEFQEMINETVDETKPLSTKLYLGRKSIFNSYNSKYLRGDKEDPQRVMVRVFEVNLVQRFKLLIIKLISIVIELYNRIVDVIAFLKERSRASP